MKHHKNVENAIKDLIKLGPRIKEIWRKTKEILAFLFSKKDKEERKINRFN